MLADTPRITQSFEVNISPGQATLRGVGLILGQDTQVRLNQGKQGSGSCFIFSNGERLPVNASFVANSARGITLRSPSGKLLSIVEHYLAALSFSGLNDIECHLQEGATELPLLDGSSLPWFEALQQAFGITAMAYTHRISQPFLFRLPQRQAVIYATPANQLQLSYTLNYRHNALRHTWATWCYPSQPDRLMAVQQLLQSRTFGEVAELPAMQASGLARGVSLENTLGLLEDNTGFTSPLRCQQEPHYHKMLDFVGDAYLSGLRMAHIQGKFSLLYAGHTSHLAFCQGLLNHPSALQAL